MKTVGTKNQHKNENQIPKGYQEGEIENTKERKINNKMNKFETMAIPVEADGIVDDQQAFEDQQEANEAQLREEIDSARQDDELYMNDYEDIEFVANNSELNSERELKRAKRKPVLAHKTYNIFARLAS